MVTPINFNSQPNPNAMHTRAFRVDDTTPANNDIAAAKTRNTLYPAANPGDLTIVNSGGAYTDFFTGLPIPGFAIQYNIPATFSDANVIIKGGSGNSFNAGATLVQGTQPTTGSPFYLGISNYATDTNLWSLVNYASGNDRAPQLILNRFPYSRGADGDRSAYFNASGLVYQNNISGINGYEDRIQLTSGVHAPLNSRVSIYSYDTGTLQLIHPDTGSVSSGVNTYITMGAGSNNYRISDDVAGAASVYKKLIFKVVTNPGIPISESVAWYGARDVLPAVITVNGGGTKDNFPPLQILRNSNESNNYLFFSNCALIGNTPQADGTAVSNYFYVADGAAPAGSTFRIDGQNSKWAQQAIAAGTNAYLDLNNDVDFDLVDLSVNGETMFTGLNLGAIAGPYTVPAFNLNQGPLTADNYFSLTGLPNNSIIVLRNETRNTYKIFTPNGGSLNIPYYNDYSTVTGGYDSNTAITDRFTLECYSRGSRLLMAPIQNIFFDTNAPVSATVTTVTPRTNETATFQVTAQDDTSPTGYATGVQTVQMSEDNFVTWVTVPYPGDGNNVNFNLTVPDTDGPKEVRFRFVDGRGNVSAAYYSAWTTLDTTGPDIINDLSFTAYDEFGALSATDIYLESLQNNSTVVNWSVEFNDAAGIASSTLQLSYDQVTWTSFPMNDMTGGVYGLTQTALDFGWFPGTLYARVQAQDSLNNISATTARAIDISYSKGSSFIRQLYPNPVAPGQDLHIDTMIGDGGADIIITAKKKQSGNADARSNTIIRTMEYQNALEGRRDFIWDLKDDDGNFVEPGAYDITVTITGNESPASLTRNFPVIVTTNTSNNEEGCIAEKIGVAKNSLDFYRSVRDLATNGDKIDPWEELRRGNPGYALTETGINLYYNKLSPFLKKHVSSTSRISKAIKKTADKIAALGLKHELVENVAQYIKSRKEYQKLLGKILKRNAKPVAKNN
jgi:hypothetical protein